MPMSGVSGAQEAASTGRNAGFRAESGRSGLPAGRKSVTRLQLSAASPLLMGQYLKRTEEATPVT